MRCSSAAGAFATEKDPVRPSLKTPWLDYPGFRR
jgi:hypothetical protein